MRKEQQLRRKATGSELLRLEWSSHNTPICQYLGASMVLYFMYPFPGNLYRNLFSFHILTSSLLTAIENIQPQSTLRIYYIGLFHKANLEVQINEGHFLY